MHYILKFLFNKTSQLPEFQAFEIWLSKYHFNEAVLDFHKVHDRKAYINTYGKLCNRATNKPLGKPIIGTNQGQVFLFLSAYVDIVQAMLICSDFTIVDFAGGDDLEDSVA